MLRSIIYYPFGLDSLWTYVHGLTRWKLSTFQDYLNYPWVTNQSLCVQLTYLNFSRVYVKFHLRNYYNHCLHEYTSLRSPKRTLYFNPNVSIEDTYCYWLPPIMTQSIVGIEPLKAWHDIIKLEFIIYLMMFQFHFYLSSFHVLYFMSIIACIFWIVHELGALGVV